MAKRKQISKKLRFDVFKRDSFECQYCGNAPPKHILHVDHIHPVKEGGTNDIDNLVTACQSCNLGKGATPLSTIPESLSEKARIAEEIEAQINGYAEIMRAKRDRIEAEMWHIATILTDYYSSDSIRKDSLISIKRFIDKLGFYSVEQAIEIAVSRNKPSQNSAFLYFCGICWNRIRALDE